MKKVLTAVLLGAMMLIASFAGAQVVTSAQGFTVTAPVALVAQSPTTGTNKYGLNYTLTDYLSPALPNGDVFMVSVAEYDTKTLDASSLQNAIDSIVAGGLTILAGPVDITISGEPAKRVVFKIDDKTRAGYQNVLRGNRMYQFIWLTNPNVESDLAGVDKFFSSAALTQ